MNLSTDEVHKRLPALLAGQPKTKLIAEYLQSKTTSIISHLPSSSQALQYYQQFTQSHAGKIDQARKAIKSQKAMTAILLAFNVGFVGLAAISDYNYHLDRVEAAEIMVISRPTEHTATTIEVKEPQTIVAQVASVKATPTPTPTPTPTRQVAGVSISRVSGTKQDWMRQAGIPQAVWGCVDQLVRRESGWRVNATNSFSGAYGLPQALPGTKMAKMGADWQYNPVTQLKWMHRYVNARYGGFCQANAFQLSQGWY